MSRYSRTQFSDAVLGQRLTTRAVRDHAHTAELLADIAEFDARKLYLPAAHPSMFSYCVHELHYGEDAALSRIRAARAAREFPAIFDAVAEGRLDLTAVILLAPRLTVETVSELLAAASFKTKAEIRLLLADRFPQQDLPASVNALPTTLQTSPTGLPASASELGLNRVEGVEQPGRVTPLAPERYGVQFTMDQEGWDLLREAQELLGHQLPSWDTAAVFKGALRAYVRELRKRKFAATDGPRATRRSSNDPRHVPAHVKRDVWVRDGGQCTFVSNAGKRCPERRRLEFDHALEVARGGRATVEGMRLRCRAHNQYTAECTFGRDFMWHKREEQRRAAAHRGGNGAGAAPDDRGAPDNDVVPWLRRLGFRADEVRRAAAFSASLPDACLEDRLRAALSVLRPRVASHSRE